MAASKNTLVNILEVSQVTPPLDSRKSRTEFSLPLTFFDTFWIRFPPVERIFFYELAEPSHLFNSVIIPQLKHSLSVALLEFLLLAGNLTWPPESPKPIILCAPNDGISLTIAESNADFFYLSVENGRDAAESRHYIPKLQVSDSEAAIMSLQITIFPNQGFSIGISAHHAVLDGKSTTMFMKAWAYICKQGKIQKNWNVSLPEELTPFFDRTVIQDPEEIALEYLKNWSEFKFPGFNTSPRSLRLLPEITLPGSNLVRGTYELSRADLKKIKKRILSELVKDSQQDPNPTTQAHLSTFVLTFAYMIVCVVKAKAKAVESTKNFFFGFTADCRARLDPPIPENYFGNCVTSYLEFEEPANIVAEKGLVLVAKKLGGIIKGLFEKGVLEGAKGKMKKFMSNDPGQGIGVAGSTRFGVYATDFGWGRPNKVEVTSIDRTGAISMAETRDGSGGVELGLVLEKPEMELFDSVFVNGLKDD